MENVLSGWFSPDELAHQRMESFHQGRVRTIVAEEAPFRLKKGTMLIVHIMPLESVRSRKRFTASDLKAHSRMILPPGEQSGRYRFNAAGYASYDGEGEIGAYTQLLRDGRLEAVMTDTAYEHNGVRALRDGLCERAIIELVSQYLPFCKGIGLSHPLWLFAALAGCEGLRGRTWHGFGEEAIHGQLVFLPEFEIVSPDIDPASHLRPLFDCLANAVGLERSPNYDEQSNRLERRGW